MSLKTCNTIFKISFELVYSFTEKPQNWKEILHSLHLDVNIDFYQKFYEPLLQDRIKTIITASWATSMEETVKYISELFEENLTGKKIHFHFLLKKKNHFHFNFHADEKSFWVEKIDDNPRSLKQALDINRQSHQLLMKAKGYTNDICQICNKLDKNIESIYNDLSLYVSSTTVESIQLHDDPNTRKLNENLVEFLRNCGQSGILE